MSWEQIYIAHETRMVDFQSHTDTHPWMSETETRDVFVELIYSKSKLQNMLRKRIDFLAWPFGSFDARCIRAAQAAGYTAAFAIRESIQKLNDVQPYAIRRISVGNDPEAIEAINAQLSV